MTYTVLTWRSRCQERSPAISVRGLRKRYGDQQVLAGLDLSVPAGSVYALLGANGAGKTTAVRILTTLIPLRRR